jgi:nicotinamide-nucleotide amidase
MTSTENLLTAATTDAIRSLAQKLTHDQMTLVTAESCTGGLLAALLTEYPGSSDWFEGAFVAYRLSAKRRFLGVRGETLDRFGAVSEATAIEMAKGALERSDADLSVAITGVAGPNGGDSHVPTGTVWVAWAKRNDAEVRAECYRFSGERADVRRRAAEKAIWELPKFLSGAR